MFVIPDVGSHTVSVRVMDGIFIDLVLIFVMVLFSSFNEEVAVLLIRIQSNGQGQVVGDMELVVGDAFSFYVVGYNEDLVYLGD